MREHALICSLTPHMPAVSDAWTTVRNEELSQHPLLRWQGSKELEALLTSSWDAHYTKLE